MQDRWKTTEAHQLMAATTAVLTLVVLAAAGLWPFDAQVSTPGKDPSVVEVALGDRVTIGLMRSAILAVVGYVVVSVPALVLERRWMQGLGTSGLTAGADRIADPEGVERQLAEIREWLATRNDQVVELSEAVESFEAKDPSSEGDDDDR